EDGQLFIDLRIADRGRLQPVAQGLVVEFHRLRAPRRLRFGLVVPIVDQTIFVLALHLHLPDQRSRATVPFDNTLRKSDPTRALASSRLPSISPPAAKA